MLDKTFYLFILSCVFLSANAQNDTTTINNTSSIPPTPTTISPMIVRPIEQSTLASTANQTIDQTNTTLVHTSQQPLDAQENLSSTALPNLNASLPSLNASFRSTLSPRRLPMGLRPTTLPPLPKSSDFNKTSDTSSLLSEFSSQPSTPSTTTVGAVPSTAAALLATPNTSKETEFITRLPTPTKIDNPILNISSTSTSERTTVSSSSSSSNDGHSGSNDGGQVTTSDVVVNIANHTTTTANLPGTNNELVSAGGSEQPRTVTLPGHNFMTDAALSARQTAIEASIPTPTSSLLSWPDPTVTMDSKQNHSSNATEPAIGSTTATFTSGRAANLVHTDTGRTNRLSLSTTLKPSTNVSSDSPSLLTLSPSLQSTSTFSTAVFPQLTGANRSTIKPSTTARIPLSTIGDLSTMNVSSNANTTLETAGNFKTPFPLPSALPNVVGSTEITVDETNSTNNSTFVTSGLTTITNSSESISQLLSSLLQNFSESLPTTSRGAHFSSSLSSINVTTPPMQTEAEELALLDRTVTGEILLIACLVTGLLTILFTLLLVMLVQYIFEKQKKQPERQSRVNDVHAAEEGIRRNESDNNNEPRNKTAGKKKRRPGALEPAGPINGSAKTRMANEDIFGNPKGETEMKPKKKKKALRKKTSAVADREDFNDETDF